MINPLYGAEEAVESTQVQYRRISDDQMFYATEVSQLPCDGTAPCSFEKLPGGETITVYPKGYVGTSQTTLPVFNPQKVEIAATRAFKDVALEALALAIMGAGAVAFGYGLGAKKTAYAVGGPIAVVVGAGLRIGFLAPVLTKLVPRGMTITKDTP